MCKKSRRCSNINGHRSRCNTKRAIGHSNYKNTVENQLRDARSEVEQLHDEKNEGEVEVKRLKVEQDSAGDYNLLFFKNNYLGWNQSSVEHFGGTVTIPLKIIC